MLARIAAGARALAALPRRVADLEQAVRLLCTLPPPEAALERRTELLEARVSELYRDAHTLNAISGR